MKAMKTMKAAMKSKKGAKVMTKSELATKMAEATDLKKSQVTQILSNLAEIGASEVVKNGHLGFSGVPFPLLFGVPSPTATIQSISIIREKRKIIGRT